VLADPGDDELLAAHRAGDGRAFGVLVGRHEGSLRMQALRTLRNPHDAADAVQEALVAAYRRADSYRGESSVRTWLHRILLNTCIDRIRHDGRRSTVPLVDEATGADLAASVAIRVVLVQALAELPVEQRLAVLLVDVQGCSVGEAAELLGVPAGTVKSRCARGRTRLATLLGSLHE
jgi:RNA polymerase sigma-70 factor (ECF subfamily)